MTTHNSDLVHRLREHATRLAQMPLTALVEQPKRIETYTIEHDDLYFDFSKHLIDEPALEDLCTLAVHSGLVEEKARYFGGARINVTENRAVLHTALRLPRSESLVVEGEDIVPKIHEVLDRATDFTDALHQGDVLGYKQDRFTDVVNIGIGGSDLGPAMAYRALWPYHHKDVRVHFVSNIDGTALQQTLASVSYTHLTLPTTPYV